MKRSRPRVTAWIVAAVFYTAAPAGAITINPSFETGDTSGWTIVGDVTVVDSSFGVTPTDGSYQLLMNTGSGAVDDVATEMAMGLPNNTIRKIFRDHVERPGESSGKRPTEGSAVQQSFDVVAVGDLMTFDWNFLTDEDVPESFYTDFLWGYLEGPSSTQELVFAHANQDASNFSASSSTFNLETGYQTFTFTFTEAGTYTLTLGVHDVEDTYRNSGVIFDGFNLIRGPEPDSFLLTATGLLGLAWYSRRHKAPR